MKERIIVNVELLETNDKYVSVDCKTDFGGVIKIRRRCRTHTKEIRELQKQDIYCFEIQGILYWYKRLQQTNQLVKYKEPENFRADERTTNELKTSGRSSRTSTSVVLQMPKAKEIKTPIQKPIKVKTNDSKEVRHEKYELIKTCIENNIPVYLAGEAGTGKNYTLEQISWDLGMPFYFTNSVQQEYKITGFIDAGGKYHETEFYKAFKNGGIFFLDEMDASIPEVLVLLNAAIANRYFEFPSGRIDAHDNFRVVSAGNTVGSGADEMYTGRLVLDQATLDRFAIIDFGYDRNIEMHISKQNKELVDFVRELRKQSKSNGIRATFSYRCIGMVTKLEKSGIDLEQILLIAVFKGMTKDVINCFQDVLCSTNKYMIALKQLREVA